MIPAPGAKRSARQGRVFSASSLFLLLSARHRVRRRGAATRCAASCTDPGHERDCALAQGGQSRLSGPIRPNSRLARSGPWNPSLTHPREPQDAPHEPILTLPGALTAYVALIAVDSSAGAAAAGTGELDHRRVRFHSEALRFHAARHHLSRRRRRQGLDLRHLFAAACQSQPYRLQRAVAVAVRQRAGAPVRRGQVLRLHGGDGGGRRAGASRHPRACDRADDRRLGLGVRHDGGRHPLCLREGQLPVVQPRRCR